MKALVIAAVLIFSNFCWAGPIIVGRGAGESEYAILFAQTQLVELLSACSLNRCSLTIDESNILAHIQTNAGKSPLALFKSEADMPGELFRLNGAQVWFNQDELWLDPSETIAYDVPHAVGLWVQVLGQGLDAHSVTTLRLKLQAALNLNLGSNSTSYMDGSLAVVFWGHNAFLRDVQATVLPLTPALVGQITAIDKDSLQYFSARWTNVDPTAGTARLDLNLMWSAQGNPMRGVGTVIMKIDGNGFIDGSSLKVLVQQE